MIVRTLCNNGPVCLCRRRIHSLSVSSLDCKNLPLVPGKGLKCKAIAREILILSFWATNSANLNSFHLSAVLFFCSDSRPPFSQQSTHLSCCVHVIIGPRKNKTWFCGKCPPGLADSAVEESMAQCHVDLAPTPQIPPSGQAPPS